MFLFRCGVDYVLCSIGLQQRVNFPVRRFIPMLPYSESNLLVSLILVSVSLDPLFFYIPVIDNSSNCLGLDNSLRIVIIVFRSFIDGLCIILRWSLHKNRRQRILSWTAVIPAILPVPQVVLYAVSWRPLTVKLLKFVVIIQFLPRIYLIILSYRDGRRYFNRYFDISVNMWTAAAFYLFMFILANNVLGAFWYLRAIERNMDCWRKACKVRGLCGVSSLLCDDSPSNNGYLDDFCSIPPVSNSAFFDHGIYLDAFKRNIMGIHTNFLNKFLYCFWWGLQSLSSLGQNLEPGTYIWDDFFAIFIVVSGLILFALLIGNMQVYLQKTTAPELNQEQDRIMKKKSQGMEIKKLQHFKRSIQVDLKRWPPFCSLPRHLTEEVILCEDEKWLRTTEINLESLLKNTSFTLRKNLKRHLCKDLFSKVEEFDDERSGLPPRAKELLRERAKPVVFQAKSIIHQEGYPLHEMIHIVLGDVLVFKKDGNKKEESQSQLQGYKLTKNDSFGKELLDKKTLWSPLPNIPLATETVQSLTKVEGFALSFNDIVNVLCRFRYFSRSCQENWASNVIVSAVRRRAAFRKVAKPSHGK